MPLTLSGADATHWDVRKIAVIGPGIVGMPMAALLAHAGLRLAEPNPPRVVVVQRASPTSGWKVEAINAGRSPIGGVEPALDSVVAESVAAGLLSATHDYAGLADADVILVCVQTDKRGIEPDYGPLFEALEGVTTALQRRPAGNVPLVIFESTLAPSSMTTVVREHFARHGLLEGRDVLQEVAPIFLGSRLGRVSYGTISRAFQQYLSTHRFEIYRFAPDQQIQIDALQVRMMLPFRSNQNSGERQLTRDGHTGAIA